MTEPIPIRPNTRSVRFAVPALLAAAGLSLLAACGDDARSATTTTAVGATTSAPTTPAPTSAAQTTHAGHATTTPASTAPASTLPASSPSSPSSTPTPSSAPEATAPAGAPTQIDVVATDYGFELSSTVAAAGPVTFALTNEGAEPHQMHIAAVPAGFTAEQFISAFQTEGEFAAFQNFGWVGGVAGVESGATQVSTVEIAPGHYIVLCFIPTPGEHGTSHLALGMASELEVVEAEQPAPDPLAVATIELTDFAVAIPERFTGGVTEVINNGSQNHELVLMKFHEGKSLADLIAWSTSGMPAERPFDYVGGTGTIAPGGRGWATLDLTSGDYVALCVVRGPTDQPHTELGMVAPFSIA